MDAVDAILTARRARRDTGRKTAAIVSATLLHGALVAAAFLGPIALARPEPLEFVEVISVPPSVLGSLDVAPEPPAPRRPEPAPEPEPPPPEPEAEPVPEPAVDRPAAPEESRPTESDRPPPAAAPARATPAPPRRAGSPTGSARGISIAGGVTGIEDPSFRYDYYVDQMLALIRARWTRPTMGSGVEVVVHFRIASDGKVRDIRVARSSGYDSFDLAGLRAVQGASPLPPLPRSYRGGSLGVNLIFR